MPGRDGTGPLGLGKRTGRGLGNCAGESVIPYGAGRGRRLACNNGVGFGYRRMNNAVAFSVKTPKELLQKQKEILQNQIDLLDKQIEKE